MVISTSFWEQQRALITGHTGFKGAWLSFLLKTVGAKVDGLSNPPPTIPSLYDTAKVSQCLSNEAIVDIRDYQAVKQTLDAFQPTVLFHLAAQPLVLESYREPLDTFSSNIMGTANILQAARNCENLKAIIVITTDKCYENTGRGEPHKESDRLGGHDPYSASKACAELVTASFYNSFYREGTEVNIATARAGNVIGGGDWASDRLLPDCIRAFENNQILKLRNPTAIRPWQHVLDPLRGYMLLAQHIYSNNASDMAWNFGPDNSSSTTTSEIAEIAQGILGKGGIEYQDSRSNFVETEILKLDSSKAKKILRWSPLWDAEKAVINTVNWYHCASTNETAMQVTQRQIEQYLDEVGIN